MNQKKLLKLLRKKFFKRKHRLGHLVFTFGVLFVVILALIDPTRLQVNHAIFLLILGLIVGLIDVPKKEANSFILAAIAIIVASLAKFEQITYKLPGMQYSIGLYIKGILLNASVFLSIVMLIVALKIIYRVYKESK